MTSVSRRRLGAMIGAVALAAACRRSKRVPEVRLTTGAGGVGFLPLLVMEKFELIQKRAADAGIANINVRWLTLGGPSVSNDVLVSDSADFVAAGPPAFSTLWAASAASSPVKGVAAMASLPMYLNTRAAHLRTLDDIRDGDKIALTTPRVSIPALVMQMYATRRYGRSKAGRFDKYTVPLPHPDGVNALLKGGMGIAAHFTSPPFHQRELQDRHVRTIMNSDDVMGGATTFTMMYARADFRAAHPLVYAAVLGALEEANTWIAANKRAAAQLLVDKRSAGGLPVDDIVAVLNDPAVVFTTTPQQVMKYATFMHDIGSIRTRPAAWTDMFFPEIHGAAGT
jgi:NitT/TauT family transport system substrate-binding protein